MGEPLRSSTVVPIPTSSSAVRWGRGGPIWSPVKEEDHQRAVSTGARLGPRGTAVTGDVRRWRSGHGLSLGWRRRSASVAGGG
jgi:hypothetical protein